MSEDVSSEDSWPTATPASPSEMAPSIPGRAKAVVAAAFVAGAIGVVGAAIDVATRPALTLDDIAVLAALGVVIAASWMWPLIIYRGKYSEAVHLDEAGLVIMTLLLPPGWTLLVFAAATVFAQLVRGRALIKTLFNFGQLSAAVGLAVTVCHALAPPTPTLTLREIGAVAVAAAVFFLVNSGSVTAILAATGTPWRESIFEGMGVRLSLVGAGVAAGILIALAVSAYRWSLLLAVPLVLILRLLLAAQFSALHDRTRLRGLLDATLRVHRNLQRGDVFEAILDSVRELLRCPDVTISETEPSPGQLGVRMPLEGGARWLIASGRSRAEPFDSADAALLETLAAVGAGALTNAFLHHQVGYERERLAAITSSLGEGVCAVDTTGALTFVNPAAAHLLGWDAPNTSTFESHNTNVADFLVAPARRAMGSGRIVRDHDATFVNRDGQPLPVAYTASAIIDQGRSVGAVIAFRDLTDRKAFEEERTRTQTERQDLESRLHQSQRLESLGQLAGGVAHDFNNLLGVISNYATFVGEKVADAADITGEQSWQVARQDISQIDEAVRRAAGLTHQLLAFARREVVQPRVLNLNELVVGVEQLLSRTLGEHVSLVTSLAPELSVVMADPGQMEQVLVNLAVNARDAMPHGGTLTIDTCNIEVDIGIDEGAYGGPQANLPSGRYARLRVRDTGAGIPDDVIGRIFEPFFTTKPKGEGSGLGLATVYGIVAQAGGYLRVDSEPDAGTTIAVLLPVTDETTKMGAAAVRPMHTSGGRGTILVVEDEHALREVTRRLLTRNGYDVLVAGSGQEAIDIAANHPDEIQLLLTDLIMPHMLGKEVAERVRTLRPATRVLYMSGFAQPILSAQGNLDPNISLLEKPFSESTLLAKVLEVMDRSGLTTTP